eukprot:1156351-Pelagomonas_calceolata.AAC.4
MSKSNRAGITNTIVTADLAAIAAAIPQGHSHIATDSLPSLHEKKVITVSRASSPPCPRPYP